MKNIFKEYNVYLILVLVLIITFLIYMPGLSGDYVFDDSANILENKKIAIDSLNISALNAVANSGDAGPLGRPISLVSFALNYYFTGFNPYYFKLTNLVIHLMNAILIYVLSFLVFKKVLKNKVNKKVMPYMAIIVSSIWLLHPINLTSVLYIVQRMTSLSAFFGLFSLVIYCVLRTYRVEKIYVFLAVLCIVLFLVLSILSKESGILFFILIYWLELIIFKGENFKGYQIKFIKINLIQYLWAGVLLGTLVILYFIPPFLSSGNFLRREFSLSERLLTESRVIFYYLKMIFLPFLSDLSLYHDDFIISKNIWSPITTLYSFIALLFISLFSILTYKRFPLILFAWGWYVISQLLESTFISLELIHEHRNYFGSIGFIILFVSVIFQIKNIKFFKFFLVLSILYSGYLATVTLQRSIIWSNLLDQALYEAAHHPYSDRANYQLARIYMKLMVIEPERKQFFAEKANESLQKSMRSYLPSNGAWFGTLHLYSEMGWVISPQTIAALKYQLKSLPFRNNNIGFLNAFVNCQIEKYCKVPHDQAVDLLAHAFENKTINDDIRAELYKLLAQYFVSVIADFEKGEEFMNDAISMKDDVSGRLLLVQIYRLQNKFEHANYQLNIAVQKDVGNVWHKEIEAERKKIKQAESDLKK